jgi:glycosyltransferase involved in cell wall biosynthesis
VIRRASRIITVSNYSRDLIAKTFNLSLHDIVVIPNSLSAEWFASEPLPFYSRNPYILTVTGDAPSKNLSSLIHAFSILKNSLDSAFHGLKLRVVGLKPRSIPHFASLAKKYAVYSSVVFEGYLAKDSLINLYRQSLLFVLPSLSEGFGIPIIEAMASGTPVACSATTSLPEILGDCGWYFDPRSPQLIAETMAIALSDHQQRDKHVHAALLRAQQYSQASVARQVHNFWDTL